MLWEVDIYPAAGQTDRAAERIASEAHDLGLAGPISVAVAHGYLLEGPLEREQVELAARALLVDGVVERAVVAKVGDAALTAPPNGRPQLVHVLPKPGVMDPVAQSAQAALAELGVPAQTVRTLRKYWLSELPPAQLKQLCSKLLANDAIEQAIVGPLPFDRLAVGGDYRFELMHVPLGSLDDDGLMRLSKQGQLYLSLEEMQTIQAHFRGLGREPTDVELETVAQTWSEHCSHKTLAGRIAYRGPDGQERRFENMLKETIFAATQEIRRGLGTDDWCVSVFKDNAGIIRFDDEYNVVFKVETHNHPSALEPYGGANTGLGGVIRDPLGTGMGAKPVCNTNVFCFAPPDTPPESLPPGVLHPRRVMKGVVSGVRDYGNRMGIPTVNGALYFDERYLGNPLVYAGNVGIIPRDKSFKAPKPGDLIVVVGGRTGRDGIHGATFSSAELTSESEDLSGGAVQIGNAITEKMVVDVILAARDKGLYNAITDCGAGGLSSAVGEMGEEIGAVVQLEKAPSKYAGLSYTELWISEAQERMVLAVPEGKWPEFHALCASEGVEATAIGVFEPTGRLKLEYQGRQVADLSMEFLHEGRPPIVRQATYVGCVKQSADAPSVGAGATGKGHATDGASALRLTHPTSVLLRILGSLNVASKEWVIRQYDHEVQGGSVIKPLVGATNDGPGDAAVVRPLLGSRRGLVVSCGMNPHYGDYDTYHMATSAIDEAVRNCVAVGADPRKIAILDNFCWGDCSRPETLGSLVRAALACYDLAIALGTPFISGKDSLNNEFRYPDADGRTVSIAIPPTLLISALGQVADVSRCVTMDLKKAGNLLFLVGLTKNELGGSHLGLVEGWSGGQAPTVDAERARCTFLAVHTAIDAGLVRACHDLSEGGLAVAAAEMAFAGGLGARLELGKVPHEVSGLAPEELDTALLFSESNTRFLCEVPADAAERFKVIMGDLPHAQVGAVTAPLAPRESRGANPPDSPRLVILGTNGEPRIDAGLAELKEAWQSPLRW
ncbi:MAG: phosphoribosylformylglycinamidine synthase subunit PurL [Pirellulales bacterium]